ncbi:MAG: laminin B domain-containing protein [Myxococcota bacterium]|nr:laminin B domain-containing protein [Myxococcota bacterium]
MDAVPYPLDDSVNWRLTTNWLSSSTATDADILDVLSSLTDLRIRGEYGRGPDTGQLDNVVLGAD